MYLTRFVDIFRQQALAETRSFTTMGQAGLPDDDYGLIEAYCTDPACDCRRVMLNVVRRSQAARGYVASISYGFDRDGEDAGPFLDPLNHQCEYAEELLEIVERAILSDPAYVARLESHYRLVKRAAADPRHPAHKRILDLDRGINPGGEPIEPEQGTTRAYRLSTSVPSWLARPTRPSQPKGSRTPRRKRR